MALTLQRTLKPLSRLRHTVSAAFLLQSGACAVVAWSVLHGGITIPAADRTDGTAGPMTPAGPMGAAGPMAAAASGTGTPVRAAGASPHSSSPQLAAAPGLAEARLALSTDRKSTRLNSSHLVISYAVFCLKKKKRCYEHLYLDISTHADGTCKPDTRSPSHNGSIFTRNVL